MPNTDLFRKTKERFSTTLSSGISDADTVIPCNNLSGLPLDTAITITLGRVDANGEPQQSWESVTGMVDGNNLIDAIRGVEGQAQSWSSGTVVEILMTAALFNDLVDGLLEQHNQDGSHKEITGTSLAVTGDIETSGGAVVTDTINEATPDAGVTVDGVLLKDGEVATDTINEATAGTGTSFPTGIVWDGWSPAEDTFVYASWTAGTRIGTITVTTDATTKYSAGMRIRLTQSTGGTKYGIIHKVEATTLTVFFESGATLANEAITAPFYSTTKNPYGFPAKTSWNITVTNDDQQDVSSPSGYRELNAANITVGIGVWDIFIQWFITTRHSTSAYTELRVALSTETEAGSISPESIIGNIRGYQTSGSGGQINFSVETTVTVTATATTTYRRWCWTTADTNLRANNGGIYHEKTIATSAYY